MKRLLQWSTRFLNALLIVSLLVGLIPPGGVTPGRVRLAHAQEPTETPTPTDTPTTEPTPTEEPTATEAPTPALSPTNGPTEEPTPIETPTDTPVPTDTPTEELAPTEAPTPTETPTDTPAPTDTPTEEPTPTETSTEVPTPEPTATPIVTPTLTITPPPPLTVTPTVTLTAIPTDIPTPGPLTTLFLKAAPPRISADGQSRAVILVWVADAEGQPVVDGTWVTASTSLGRLEEAQAATRDGAARFTLRAGQEPGLAVVTVRAREAQREVAVELVTPVPGQVRISDSIEQGGSPFDPAAIAEVARHPVALADGVATARGEAYQLRFDGSGMIFTFQGTGSEAFPSEAQLTFTLLTVRVGKTVLYSGRGGRAPLTVWDNRARAVRAPRLSEEYVALDEGVEQVFTLERKPPQAGDLVIEGVFHTTLQPELVSDQDGIYFLDDQGRPVLGYSGAVARDALGREQVARLALDTSRVQITVPESWLQEARYPLTVDPLIGDPFLVSGAGTNQAQPAVAYNPDDDEYLVVWKDRRNGDDDLYARRISSSGAPLGSDFAVVAAPNNSAYPDVAYNTATGEYLVVWKDKRNGNYDIYAQRVSAEGTLVGPEIAIALSPDYQVYPAVAYHPLSEEWLVVWHDLGTMRVYGQRVAGSGALIGPAFDISGSGGGGPAVAANGDDGEYLVVWPLWGCCSLIRAQRLLSDGTLIGDQLTLSSEGDYHTCRPAVVYDSENGQYLAAWRDERNADWDIYGQRVLASGELAGENLVLCGASGDQDNPAVAWDGRSGRYLVIWEDAASTDMYGQRVLSDGTLEGGNLLLSDAGGRPDLAYGQQDGSFLLVGESGGYIYAQRYGIPVADFEGAPLTGSVPLTVTFTSLSTPLEGIDSHEWDFGDGVTSTITNPTHVYTATGVYTVSLTVTATDSEQDVETKASYITATAGISLTADFSAAPLSGTVPLTVTFTDESTGTVDSRLWDFGDGVTDTVSTITTTHTYTATDVYTVALTIEGPGGSDTLTRTGYITAYVPLAADFSAAPLSGTVPLTVTFTDESTGTVDSRLWDFGDGITLTVSTITTTHTYTASGVYTVALTIEGPGGSDTLTRTGYITAYVPLVASLEAVPLSVQVGQPITVTMAVTNGATGPVEVVSPSVLTTTAFLDWGPVPVSATLAAGQVVTFTWVYTAAQPGSVTWQGYAGGLLQGQPITSEITTSNNVWVRGGRLVWWDDDFFFRRPLTVTVSQPLNYTPGVTTPLGLTLDTASLVNEGQLRGDGHDLRVAYWDGLAWEELPRWVQAMGNPTSTVIFPLRATITDTDDGYWLYYGNAVAGKPPKLLTDTVTSEAMVTTGLEETAAVTETIEAALGGELLSADGRTQVVFPPGAVTETVLASHTPYRAVYPQPGETLARFDLEAQTLGGGPVTEFSQPVTLTFDYSGLEVDPSVEDTMTLYRWDEGLEEWQPISSTLDTGANLLTAVVDHFSDHAITTASADSSAVPTLPATVAGFQTDLFTGASTFGYPIQVAPGTAGMQPALSLSYSSLAADQGWPAQAGWVGFGFSLDAGYIARGDPNDTPNDLGDDTFHLVLNGVSSELVVDGVDPDLFHTKQETYWRIRRHTGGESGADNGQYWTVTDKNGTEYRFGYTEDAAWNSLTWAESEYVTHTYRYGLDRVTDVHGNYMTFEYEKVQGEFGDPPAQYDRAGYLQRIRYTGNDSTGLSPQREVVFVTSNRAAQDYPDSLSGGPSYPDKQHFFQEKKLDAVEVRVDGALVRKYALSYHHENKGGEDIYAGQRLLLDTITQLGSDGATPLITTTFTYYGDSNASTWQRLMEGSNNYGASVSYQYDSIELEDDVQRVRVVHRTVSDGGAAHVYGYGYETPQVVEDEFRGHDVVTVILPNNESSIFDFDQGLSDEPLKGRLERVEKYDDQDTWQSTQDNTWQVEPTGGGAHFVCLDETLTTIDPSDSIRVSYFYDDYGNLSQVHEFGEPDNGYDDRWRVVSYTLNTADWIVNRPKAEEICDYSQSAVARSEYYYDHHTTLDQPPDKGDLTRVVQVDLDRSNDLVTEYDHDDYGNVTQVTDGQGQTTVTTYDTTYHTFPETVDYPVTGLSTTSHYDARFGLVEQFTDLNGQTTGYEYDIYGRLREVWAPLDDDGSDTPAVEYIYTSTPSGLEVQTQRKEAYGSSETYNTVAFYNGLGQLVQTTAEGESGPIYVDYQYDGLGRQWKVSAPYTGAGPQLWTETTYDALGRLKQVTNTDGTSRQYTYTGWERVEVRDENQHYKGYDRDAFGRTVQVDEYNGGLYATTYYGYDLLGNLTGVEDDLGHTTVITYDSLGRKLSMDDPDMGTWSYTYDLNGNLATQTDASGTVITFTYDALDRLETKTYSDPNTAPVTYTYDVGVNGKGRRTGMADASGTAAYTYDEQGRLLTETKTIDGAAYSTGFTYDPMDRVRTMTYPDPSTGSGQGGEVITYDYNDQGLLKSMDGLDDYVNNLDYNALGQTTHLVLGNGLATTYDYHDTNFRLESVVTTGGLQNLHYTYDNVGNVQTMADSVGGLNLTYGYDELDRLTGVSGTYARSYDYNSIGNLLDKNGLTLYYIDSDHPHAVSHTSDNIVYYYSPTGNMVTKWVGGPQITFGYDAENRLAQVVSDTTSSAITTTFVYDGDGQRVKKVEGSETTVYIGQHYETSVPSVIYTDTTWISGTYTLNGPLVVENSATLYLEGVVAITACQIIVGPDAAISADERGYLGQVSGNCPEHICGPGMGYEGQGTDDGGGGGHGGYGGCSDLADSGCVDGHSGQIYGDAQTPVTMGSGGGGVNDDPGGQGGDGGGSVRLTAETILIDGRVSANGAWGECGQWSCGGGGAGGSIWITAEVLTGTGVIEAEGGGAPEDPGGYRRSGGGGGGRIALYYSEGNFDLASGKLSVAGGESVEGYDGEPGTVYISSAVPTFPPCASFATKHYYANGQRVATRVGGTLYYVHSDHLGSTVAVSDAAGQAVGRVQYDPYGEVLTNTLPAHLTDRLFTGARFDGTIGLYQMGARWYDPALGRWIQPDTIVPEPGNPQALNRYAYVYNNPLKYIDPSGHDPPCSLCVTALTTLLGMPVCSAPLIGNIGRSYIVGKIEDELGWSGPSDLNKNVQGARLIRKHHDLIVSTAVATDHSLITPGLLAAIVRTQGGPNYPLLGWPEGIQWRVGACRGECSLGIAQMDVGNAMRLEELGLMPSQGGKEQTTRLLASDPEANLMYMVTMLAYGDQLLVDFWREQGMGTPPDRVRLEVMAMLQNSSISGWESQLAGLKSKEDWERYYETSLSQNVNIPKVIPWIEWSQSLFD